MARGVEAAPTSVRQGPKRSGDAVGDAFHAQCCGTLGAAVHPPPRLDPMADHTASAVGTGWREPMDGALEAIEYVALAAHRDLEGLVVVDPAHLTLSHPRPPLDGRVGCAPPVTLCETLAPAPASPSSRPYSPRAARTVPWSQARASTRGRQ